MKSGQFSSRGKATKGAAYITFIVQELMTWSEKIAKIKAEDLEKQWMTRTRIYFLFKLEMGGLGLRGRKKTPKRNRLLKYQEYFRRNTYLYVCTEDFYGLVGVGRFPKERG